MHICPLVPFNVLTATISCPLPFQPLRMALYTMPNSPVYMHQSKLHSILHSIDTIHCCVVKCFTDEWTVSGVLQHFAFSKICIHVYSIPNSTSYLVILECIYTVYVYLTLSNTVLQIKVLIRNKQAFLSHLTNIF